MIIFLFIIFLSSVGVRSEEKAGNSESDDNVSISLSLSRLCQGKADTSGQGSCLKKEEKEKITGLSDKIADIQAQQSKMMKIIENQKNVLEDLGAEMKQLLKHIKTIQPKDTEEIQLTEFSASIQPTEPPTESPTSSMPKRGKIELITERGKPGASSVYDNRHGAALAFISNDDYWLPEDKQLPATIWMRFPRAHRLAAIGYRNYKNGYDPKSLQVIGSNDCATWTTLLTVDNTGFTKTKEFRKWYIPAQNQQMFSCLGFMWQSNAPVIYSYTVIVREIRMWEAV